jgi:hypothetical protein
MSNIEVVAFLVPVHVCRAADYSTSNRKPGEQQPRCQVIQDRRGAHVVEMRQGQIDTLADKPLIFGDRGANEVGGQFQH